ncbi:CRAL/TRIO domain-containing protein [Westerdykella ornata]|uniref:CRAL/TRIO domain-containing protein n=1 Tax=Westerdykella ornata TaxID=318751 RepID=A0A6A6J8U3_WESOR|nr:CRAL/TRIO domain-containing protein [Westerdykella ornata]KAF2272428.1 CRAL/TRIO domain-containing protein [Westerdykella ornata]
MAPNTPPGRPGTLTVEQELKLRELWAATMKVFGVYEAPGANSGDANTTGGAESPSVAASSDAASEKDATGKKEKKKSRLNVFKRKDKGEKNGATSDSAPASGTSTLLEKDISAMAIADEDDKHGQTKAFKQAIANSSPEEIRDTFWSMVKHDHPDGLLLRFLRARKWDVEKALVMMISTMHWRAEEMHVDDDIMANGELHALRQSQSDDPKVKKEGEDFLAQLRMGKSFLHGLDKEGRPMCVVRVRLHRGGEQSEESIERFTVYTIETARMFLRPPVDTATILFDMTSFSMANMDYAPLKFMIKCFEANYPESLGTVLVYKAPWIFNTIWNMIRGWLDPVVAGKVHFVKSPEELEQFVEKSRILEELGGEEKWSYTYVEPADGENDKMKDENRKEELKGERQQIVNMYESEVLRWIHAGAAEKENSDVSADLAQRRRTRDELAEQLRQNYWKLDPYVRARTLYERIGMLKEGGAVDFYPTAAPVAAAAPATTTTTQETSPDDLD